MAVSISLILLLLILLWFMWSKGRVTITAGIVAVLTGFQLASTSAAPSIASMLTTAGNAISAIKF